MKSIIQTDKDHCYICGKNKYADYFGLDRHHVYFGTANRKKSEQYGLTVYLCHNECHLHGVHSDTELCRALQAKVQRIAMEHYGWTVEQFIEIFGRTFI